jgi:hypothetical protein
MLAKLLCFNFIFLSILQVAALFYFGLPGTSNSFKLFLRDETTYDLPVDCFIDLGDGAYKFCTATQKVSIAGSIMFLMLQLLVSRFIFPGVSNFLNASVGTCSHAAASPAMCPATVRSTVVF